MNRSALAELEENCKLAKSSWSCRKLLSMSPCLCCFCCHSFCSCSPCRTAGKTVERSVQPRRHWSLPSLWFSVCLRPSFSQSRAAHLAERHRSLVSLDRNLQVDSQRDLIRHQLTTCTDQELHYSANSDGTINEEAGIRCWSVPSCRCWLASFHSSKALLVGCTFQTLLESLCGCHVNDFAAFDLHNEWYLSRKKIWSWFLETVEGLLTFCNKLCEIFAILVNIIHSLLSNDVMHLLISIELIWNGTEQASAILFGLLDY